MSLSDSSVYINSIYWPQEVTRYDVFKSKSDIDTCGEDLNIRFY